MFNFFLFQTIDKLDTQFKKLKPDYFHFCILCVKVFMSIFTLGFPAVVYFLFVTFFLFYLFFFFFFLCFAPKRQPLIFCIWIMTF